MVMKNWVYRADRPTEMAEAVEQALHEGHVYRNSLVRLELDKRQRYQELLRRLVPEYVDAERRVAQAEQWLALARESIQSERCKQRTKKPKHVRVYQDAAKLIKATLKDRRAIRKTAKKESHEREDVQAALAENTERHKRDVKALQAASPLYWATRGIINRSTASFGSGPPPRFTRFTGAGKVATQLQKGLDCQKASDENTIFQVIIPPDVARRQHENKSVSGLKNRAEILIRIGSDGGRPVFARAPIRMHRALPVGSIKWAILERTRIGSHTEWNLRMEIDCPDPPSRDHSTWVALHTGWKRVGARIKACTWKGSDGRIGEEFISDKTIRQYNWLDEIRSRRDGRFVIVCTRMADWIDARKKTGNPIPEWLDELRPHMKKWRSPARMHQLALKWREHRFANDSTAYAWLHGLIDDPRSGWRKWDKRLYDEHAYLSRRLSRRRKDQYRKLAKRLSSEYGVLIEAKIDAKKLTENSTPEELESDNHLSHRMAKIAAVGELQQLCREAFGPLSVISVSTINLTLQCHRCGFVNKPSKAASMQCRECGWTGGHDVNGVNNQLIRGEDAITAGELSQLVIAQEEKQARSAEKRKKMQDGRRAARKREREKNARAVASSPS